MDVVQTSQEDNLGRRLMRIPALLLLGPIAMVVMGILEFFVLGARDGATSASNAILSAIFTIPIWILLFGPIWAINRERPPSWQLTAYVFPIVLIVVLGNLWSSISGGELSYHNRRALIACLISTVGLFLTIVTGRGAAPGSTRSLGAWIVLAHSVGTLLGSEADFAS